MFSNQCPHCVDGIVSEETYAKTVKRGRRSVDVKGLKRYTCGSCAGHYVTRVQLRENNRLIEDASNEEVATCVSPADLKALRARCEFTQKAASHWFGAGSSSFAKWESGQSAMSAPAALLVRCAIDIPEVMPYLISLQSNELPKVNDPFPANSDYKVIIHTGGKDIQTLRRALTLVREVHTAVSGRTVTHLIAQYEPNGEIGREWALCFDKL